jgi:hypothetical protein
MSFHLHPGSCPRPLTAEEQSAARALSAADEAGPGAPLLAWVRAWVGALWGGR